MEISIPNENGVLDPTVEEIVARHGRSHAEIPIALCEDGLYRQSASLHYSYGGFSSPISIEDIGYASIADARTAGLEELLRRWHTPYPSYPRSVHDELADLRQQIVNQLQQPMLL
jgi:hypothetical protein